MFENCTSLKIVDLSLLNTENVTNMKEMFNGCFNLSNLLIPLDTKNVTNISSMFYDCKRLTMLDLSNMDITNITESLFMFKYCTNLKKIILSNDNYAILERALRWDNIYPEIEVK